jgi:hypothetical protein
LSDALECDPFEEQFAALVASWRERGEALRVLRAENARLREEMTELYRLIVRT